MADPKIASKKPIVIEMEPGTYWWCACGHAVKQPFCDGSHNGTEFSPMSVEIKQKMRIAWCTCKYSNNKPYCDGKHASLP